MTKQELKAATTAAMTELAKRSVKSRHAGMTKKEISQHYSELRRGTSSKRKRV
jgi:hypothetical protein